MDARAEEFHMESLRAREWIEDVVAEFQSEVEEAGYRVEVAANGIDTKLLADRVALSHMIWNLLDNAVKYSPNCKTVWVEVEQDVAHLLIRVRDRGLGIEPGEQRRIFEKFVRGSAAENRSAPGTGLGLTMVRHIVEAHGGSIDVTSKPGQGSTFTIYLPIQG
jgi:signal transduction histidine kinase